MQRAPSSFGGPRPHVLAARERLEQGRQKLRERHARGASGAKICRELTALYDEILVDFYDRALADFEQSGAPPLASQTALVAHGGYGRSEVAPFSDVDVMLLHTRSVEKRMPDVAQRMIQDLSDVGFSTGLNYHTSDSACHSALDDPRVCSSFIESRFVAGNQALVMKFRRQFARRVRRRRRPLATELLARRRSERSQYGETVYLLQPNVKRSRGGLRDLQMLRWWGFFYYGAADPETLLSQGSLPPGDFQVVQTALEFLLRVRNELHFAAGRTSDALPRAEQKRIAELLDYPGDESMLPVERFMSEYFRHTRAASNVIGRFVATAFGVRRPPVWLEVLYTTRFERDFRVGPVRITANSRGLHKVRSSLTEVLRLADLASSRDRQIDHLTVEEIRLAVPAMDRTLTETGVAHFRSLLAQPRHLGSTLRLLHDIGVLEEVVPEFNHARCLLQFNEYHCYTVDEHCIRAVEHATGFWHDDGPVGRVYRSIDRKWLLHLALLIHDLGKGHARDHCDVGVDIAQRTAARLGLSKREGEILEYLVHRHLAMSHLANRRNTRDPQLAASFAFEVGSPEVLKMLYVLTAADFLAVGPNRWDAWKGQLLTELYDGTMRCLSGDTAHLLEEEALERRRADVLRCCGDSASLRWYKKQVESLPNDYLLNSTPEHLAEQLRELHELPEGEVRAVAEFMPAEGTVRYSVSTYESVTTGAFHKLTGALSAAGLQILSAEIDTLAEGLILDRFVVFDPDYEGEPPPDRTQRVCDALRQALLTPSGEAPNFRRTWQEADAALKASLSGLPTQVRIDNNSSRDTIIDVFAPDKTGLLFTIARRLYELGLSVNYAKIGTYLDQVVDAFYVTDQSANKIEDEAQVEAIRAGLLEAIDAFEREETAPVR